MSGTIINLIIQIVSGAIGGNAAGGFLKNIILSPLAKTISGAVGGGIGGTLLQSLIPALSDRAGRASGVPDCRAERQKTCGSKMLRIPVCGKRPGLARCREFPEQARPRFVVLSADPLRAN